MLFFLFDYSDKLNFFLIYKWRGKKAAQDRKESCVVEWIEIGRRRAHGAGQVEKQPMMETPPLARSEMTAKKCLWERKKERETLSLLLFNVNATPKRKKNKKRKIPNVLFFSLRGWTSTKEKGERKIFIIKTTLFWFESRNPSEEREKKSSIVVPVCCCCCWLSTHRLRRSNGLLYINRSGSNWTWWTDRSYLDAWPTIFYVRFRFHTRHNTRSAICVAYRNRLVLPAVSRSVAGSRRRCGGVHGSQRPDKSQTLCNGWLTTSKKRDADAVRSYDG